MVKIATTYVYFGLKEMMFENRYSMYFQCSASSCICLYLSVFFNSFLVNLFTDLTFVFVFVFLFSLLLIFFLKKKWLMLVICRLCYIRLSYAFSIFFP